jgi:hypothetical protein
VGRAEGEVENAEQKQAMEIVEACLQTSFGFGKLGSLWRKHESSDNVSDVCVFMGESRWDSAYVGIQIDQAEN